MGFGGRYWYGKGKSCGKASHLNIVSFFFPLRVSPRPPQLTALTSLHCPPFLQIPLGCILSSATPSSIPLFPTPQLRSAALVSMQMDSSGRNFLNPQTTNSRSNKQPLPHPLSHFQHQTVSPWFRLPPELDLLPRERSTTQKTLPVKPSNRKSDDLKIPWSRTQVIREMPSMSGLLHRIGRRGQKQVRRCTTIVG